MIQFFSWGRGDHGQLGVGGNLEQPFAPNPLKISNKTFLSPADTNDDFENKENKGSSDHVVQISGGVSHTLALTNNGRIYSCGSNDFSQLGHSDKVQSRFEVVDVLESYDIKSVASGQNHNLAVDEWGKVFSWGHDDRGQCGQNNGKDRQEIPKIIRGLGTYHVVQVAAGSTHSLVLTDSGRLFSFGDNTFGQLGLGATAGERFLTPQPIKCLEGLPILSIACGGFHSVIVSLSGAVFSWGKNTNGQLGNGTKENQKFPLQIRSLRSQNVVQVACGELHTLCLTADGGVFSFGAGTYGQLGHGTLNNEATPRKIMELMGTEVSQIACGSRHSLAFVPSRGRLYSFGLGGSGQLGRGSTLNANSPQVVLGPWGNMSGKAIVPLAEKDSQNLLYLIGAAGDQSFGVVCPLKEVQSFRIDRRQIPAHQKMKTLTLEILDKIGEANSTDTLDLDFLQIVETIFQSISCLNGSLLLLNHIPSSSKNPGVDLDAWRSGFGKIEKSTNDSLKDAIHDGITNFVLPKLSEEPPDIETMRLYLPLQFYHRFEDVSCLTELQMVYANRMINLTQNAWNVMEKWIKLQDSSFLKPLVKNMNKNVVKVLGEMKTSPIYQIELDRQAMTLLIFLRVLNRINVESDLIINYEDFYIPEVNKLVDFEQAYPKWLAAVAKDMATNRFFICNFPFIFDATAKTALLEIDQIIKMTGAMREAQMNAAIQSLYLPIDPSLASFFHLHVSRKNIVGDTLNQFQLAPESEFKKPLKVVFENEEAEDAGGVRKEFFLLLIREILDPKFGMFKFHDETRTIWFNSFSFDEDTVMFFMIGVICGLAIYNFTIINLPFPLALYKKLLDKEKKYKPSVEDLSELSPSVAKGLKDLLDYEGEDLEEVFCLDFTISQDFFGEIKTAKLGEDGEKTPVTQANKKEYVDLYCDFVLNKSVLKQYEAFRAGFFRVCAGRVLDLFQARELMTLVMGNENYDWQDLENTTQYKNGYDKDHQTIVNFWSVFHELSLKDKKNFLMFLTGCDRVPITGLGSLKLTIQRTGDDNFLPVAHTCFNLLDLPEYGTREKLKYKLLKAIQHTEGFGLA